LKVIVDVTPPKLTLELVQPAPGRVQLLWNASDEHLDLTQLRLEYTQPGTPDWQLLTVVPKATGQTGWVLPQGGGVTGRGPVADVARNVSHDQTQLKVAAASQAVPRPDPPGGRQPFAGRDGGQRDTVALSIPEHFPTTRPDDGNSEASEDGAGLHDRQSA